ncbi:MAG: phage tail protein [Paludibacteraceae bacterium]
MSMTTSGKNVNLTLEEGRETRFRMKMWTKDEEWSGEGLTFDGEVRDLVTGEALGAISVSWETGNRLILVFPALSLGRYVFVVDAASDGGDSVRLLDGYVSYGQQESVSFGDDEVEVDRTLNVMVAGELRRVMFGRSSVAEDAADRAENAYGEAVATIERAEEERRELIEAADRLNESISGSIGLSDRWTLVIGGIDTGFVMKGESGKAPVIGTDGYWYQWDDGQQGYVRTETKAIGRDGVDGDKFRYVMLGSVDELESVAERYGVLYIVPTESGNEAYAWVEHSDGGGEWARMDNVQQVATMDLHGKVKLGTDVRISSGLPVGNDVNGRMCVYVPEASTTALGLVKFDPRTGNLVPNASLMFVGLGKAVSDSKDGQISKGTIGFNVLIEGALQYRSSTEMVENRGGWLSDAMVSAMPWLEKNKVYFSDKNQYLGLLTERVFTQSTNKGLQLNVDDDSFIKDGELKLKAATTSTRGGVILAGSMADADKVPTAALVKGALDEKVSTEAVATIVEQKVKDAVDAALASISGVPAGQISFYAGVCELKDSFGNWKAVAPPAGYLWCHGQEVSRATYANLFAAIGTVYGDGDGSTTFNVPSAEDYFLRVYRRHDGVTDTRKLGTTQDSGAPNITGSVRYAYYGYGSWELSGAFCNKTREGWATRGGGGGNPSNVSFDFDASQSSAVYQDGLTEVRPKNINFNLIIKY